MRQIADLHIHSRFSRACSGDLTLANLDRIGRTKGVDIIATGDFTQPDWFGELRGQLAPAPARARKKGELYIFSVAPDEKVKFILSAEVALIFKKFDRVRRIHLVAHAPDLDAAAALNAALAAKYNIHSDGRPILGMSAEDFCGLCFSVNPHFIIYPAHIWTPWFSVFGSKSGFDRLEECFGEYTGRIRAYETGLSSDPAMNWRLSALDDLTRLSNSDAHSLPNIGREANVFELTDVSYDELYDVIDHHQDGQDERSAAAARDKHKSYLDYTLEFYPEEGMYHYDGHRACGVCLAPEASAQHRGRCPVCHRPLTIGVLSRVAELADRPAGYQPASAPGFRRLVELDKIIAETLGVKSRSAAKVKREYERLFGALGTEMAILLDRTIDEIKAVSPASAEGIRRVRAEEVNIQPGFDGQYGQVKIFTAEEKHRQSSLL